MFSTDVGIPDIVKKMGLNKIEEKELQKLTTEYLMLLAETGQRHELGFITPILSTDGHRSLKETLEETLNNSSFKVMRAFVQYFMIENNKYVR